jgi:YD repeat-containing protein
MIKPTGLFLLIVLPVLLQAQQHYTVNWAVCPKNPVAFTYTSNHYAYAGKVKSLKEEWGSMHLERSFDEAGLQQTGVSNVLGNEITTFQYKPEQQQLVKIQEAGGTTISTVQTLNEKMQVVRSSTGAAQQYNFLYNEKGLLAEKRFPGGSAVTRYFYNEAGQLQKEALYRDTLLTIEYTYEYKKTNTLLEVTCTTLYKSSGTREVHKEFYNSSGMLVKEITAEEERTYEYQLDASGNWITKKTSFKNRSSKSVISKDSKRTILYW